MINPIDRLDMEWRYIYEERIGIMCEGKSPTKEQLKIATKEADEHIRILKETNAK